MPHSHVGFAPRTFRLYSRIRKDFIVAQYAIAIAPCNWHNLVLKRIKYWANHMKIQDLSISERIVLAEKL